MQKNNKKTLSVSKTGCLNRLLRNTAVRVHDGEVIPTL